MRALGRTFSRFEQILTAEDGSRIRGSIQTMREGVSGLANFIETRQTLHCRIKEPARIGSVVTDEFGRRFLIAYHDRTADVAVYKLFTVNDLVSWTRPQNEIEPVTGLLKAESTVELGPIWVALELYGRQEVDRATHIGMDRSRVLTGSPVQLGDKIDGRLVRRLYVVYGISVVEIQ